MNYYEVAFLCTPNETIYKDVLTSFLGDIGFESFTEDENANLIGYITEDLFDPEDITNVADVLRFTGVFPSETKIKFRERLIISQNWNEEWEKYYFQPIIINDECIIHSSFHKDIPAAKYDIVIDPKMSFGTGHHETTSMMISFLLEMELKGKSFLDMGCGTAVLAILASLKGASPILAIDNDEWAYNNSLENIQLNNTKNIQVEHGDVDLVDETIFDVIYANINRNILLNDIRKYAASLAPQGELYMSGFYKEDIPIIEEECKENGLALQTTKTQNDWVAVKFIKC